MPKIIQISPYTFHHPGGVEQYARVLQETFPGEILTLSWWGEFPILEPVKNCPLPCFWQKWFWKTFDTISRENTEYIVSHIRFAPTAWLAFFLAKKRWIPYIHIEHGTGFLVHKNPLIALIAKMVDLTLWRWIIRHADEVVCISEAGKKWVEKTFSPKKNISVIYRGFSFPEVTRKTHAIPKIGFVGRLTGLKYVHGLLEALSEITQESWTLEIVWDGEERKELQHMTKHLHLEERVTFLWARDHEWIMKEFYPSVDICINPSLQEWLPTTVIEALGMGCYTIATDVGGSSEIHGVHLIPAWSIPSIREALREACKKWAPSSKPSRQFSLESMKVKYKNLFSI